MTDTWVYRKVYLESAGIIDSFIKTSFRCALSIAPDRPWFFIRYTDEGGPHIRFRIKVAASEAERVGHFISNEFQRAIGCELPMAGAPLFISARMPVMPTIERRLVVDEYVPETDVYGGVVGVEIAEEVFWKSSSLALGVIEECPTARVDRKALPAALMMAGADAFRANSPGFWGTYASQWLGGSPQSSTFLSKVEAKFRQLRTAGHPIVALDYETSSEMRQWRGVVQGARQRLRRTAILRPENEMSFLANFVHLMNNRLGVSILEEAYLAKLLELHLAETRAAGKAL